MEQDAAKEFEEKICKICQIECDKTNASIHPCKCKGSLKYIHLECLNEWIALSKKKKCEICGHPFKFQKTFKPNAPKNVPFYCIVLFLIKSFYSKLIDFICLTYTITRLSLILFLTIYINKKYLSTGETNATVLIQSFISIGFSLLCTHLSKRIIKRFLAIRIRIQSGIALNNLQNDLNSRTDGETDVSQNTVIPTDQSDSSESADQTVLNDLEQGNLNSINDYFFRKISLSSIRQDIVNSLSLLQISLYFLINQLLFNQFSKLFSFKSKLVNNSFFRFVDLVGLTRFYQISFFSLSVNSIVLGVLYILKTRTVFNNLKILFYLIKTYAIVFIPSIFSAISVGLLTHFSFSLSVNAYDEINIIPIIQLNSPFLSLIFHLLLGFIFTFLIKEVNENLSKKFRSGLIQANPSDKSFSRVIDFALNDSLPHFLIRFVFNFIFISFLPCITFLISIPKNLNFSFKSDNSVLILMYFKSFFIIANNGSNVAKFFAKIFGGIVKFLSKFFYAENYLYNTHIPILDKKRLIWAMNKNDMSPDTALLLRKINSIVSESSLSSKKDATKNFQSNSLKADDVNQTLNVESESIPRLRTKVRVPIVYLNDSSTTSVFDQQSNTTFSNSDLSNSKHSKSFINSKISDETIKIQKRFELTPDRINKYYGQKHDKRVSIFYKPKFFSIFKLLIIFICFAFVQLFFSLIFQLSNLICKFINLKTEESMAVSFIYFSCLILVFSTDLSNIFNGQMKFKLKNISNPLILTAYSNLLFPFLAAILNVFIYSDLKFTEFTKCFFFLNAFSGFTSGFFKAIFVITSVQSYNSFYLLKQLVSFAALKFVVFLLFLAYSKIIIFSSIYLPVFFFCVLAFQLYRIIQLLNSGSLMERIKDHFYLENISILNYSNSDGE
jgi:hypothetical protein